MTSFSWKRKRNLKTDAAAAFREEREQEEEEAWEIDGVDWLTAAKRRRTLLLEDSESKSKRYRDLDLQQFLCVLASLHLVLMFPSLVLLQHFSLFTVHPFARLQGEGALLAENGRYWEAIKYWDEALQLAPDSAVLHEMKAQVRSQAFCMAEVTG